MADTSSDDFSDIEYGQTKNEDVSDDNHKTYLESETNASFESDELETEITSKVEHMDIDPMKELNEADNSTNNNPNSDLYYNPRDYDSLTVNNEIHRLFEYIERFKCNEIELETQLKPFIPDYIPSIGNVDSFIKPTLSTIDYDKQENNEKLGIYYLDEPILNQSDPSTFYLKLSNESKQVSTHKHTKISSIADAEKNTNKVRNWIDNFKEIKDKSLSNNLNIDNLSNMPKVEELMHPFINEKFNKYIQAKRNKNDNIIPSHQINLSLNEYAQIICNLLDIPIQNDDVSTSLHVLFSTYGALQSISNH